MEFLQSYRIITALPVLAGIAAFIASPHLTSIISTQGFQATNMTLHNTSTDTKALAGKAPVYFLSHGGPTVQYDTEHGVYPILQRIGLEITQKIKPKAVVVFSAHWAGKEDEIFVNDAIFTDLIYDFYGFPPHYYDAQYPSVGDPDLAQRIIGMLSEAGISSRGFKRGLDHGVWSGFSVAFNPETNPLNVPLVQVSLFKNESPAAHIALGRAVAALRDQNIVIICAGMSVHNLRDLGQLFAGNKQPLPYTVSFDVALKEAVEADPAERDARMTAVCRRPDARQAHPTMDHLMPVHIAVGAAGDDLGKQLWTLQEGSLGWAQYRFGDLP
ncbi:hypothetical protein S7711_04892 [Stachybotrys chartarum IBT 7711]|uniref:Extradiol ring-cleavage dioxygenase class III enzyme subunit B domain-containing protein n=1 Tax=Stachybotrys chartarum (strain CBS 109288 / IBT 7711) TaxID=1280523 RepID=A0A084B6G5_STACB|nr:hypothetical protein S7711_04892 [Stachybotrys chartarum IBT 7711]KFA53948.1 hypothetical protein S40293_01758 [Stachybotrys chartarum IBT 40293]